MSPERAPGRLRLRPSLALVAALAFGCAVPVESAGAPITNGALAEGDPAVVLLEGGPVRCTGVLVAPDVVLTAAHCRAQDDPLAIRVRAEGRALGLRDAVAHPEADDTATHDLALLLLEEPLATAPVPLDRAGAIAAAPPVAVRIVGFGVTAAGGEDDGTKREGTSVTSDVTEGFVELAADPSLPCNGDSGGAVLVRAADGERLGAVISRGDAACEAQGKATRVDAHVAGFIEPQLAAWAAGEVRGAFGAPCADAGDCLGGECSAAGLCSRRCDGDADCPAGFACAYEGGADFRCAPADDGGCSATGTPAPAFLALALGIGWLRRRR